MHRYLWSIQIKYLSLHLKNHQNFKGLMVNGHSINSNTLRQRIEALPEATRDKAQVLPSGMTALNILGLSTQVPMNYTYLTTDSERTVKLANRQNRIANQPKLSV